MARQREEGCGHVTANAGVTYSGLGPASQQKGGDSKTDAVTNIEMCGFCGQRRSDFDSLRHFPQGSNTQRSELRKQLRAGVTYSSKVTATVHIAERERRKEDWSASMAIDTGR